MRVSRIIDNLKQLPEISNGERIYAAVESAVNEYQKYLTAINEHASEGITVEAFTSTQLSPLYEIVCQIESWGDFIVITDGELLYAYGPDIVGGVYDSLAEVLDDIVSVSAENAIEFKLSFNPKYQHLSQKLMDWNITRNWRE